LGIDEVTLRPGHTLIVGNGDIPGLGELRGSLTYDDVGATLNAEMPPGFGHIRMREKVSGDPALLSELGRALTSWQIHQRCMKVTTSGAARTGRHILMTSPRLPGVRAECVVVYVIDEPDRVGFAYGTLQRHPECGEEAFILERTPEGIYFNIVAFSKPHTLWAHAAGPLGRSIQDRFTRRYIEAMRSVSAELGSSSS